MVVFAQLPDENLWLRELQNTSHIVIFFIISIMILHTLRLLVPVCYKKNTAAYLVSVFACFALALATELGQLLTNRAPDVTDLLYDMLGSVAGLGLYSCIDPFMKEQWARKRNHFKIIVMMICILIIIVGIVPLSGLSLAYVQRYNAYPVLMDFGKSWTSHFIELQHAKVLKVSAPQNLKTVTNQEVDKLILEVAEYPGVSIIEPYPDWSKYNDLVVELFYDKPQPVNLVLRVHDRRHDQDFYDRYNQKIIIVPGFNRVIVPLRLVQLAPRGRKMDMHKISGVVLFAANPSAEIDLYSVKLSLK